VGNTLQIVSYPGEICGLKGNPAQIWGSTIEESGRKAPAFLTGGKIAHRPTKCKVYGLQFKHIPFKDTI